MNVLLLVYAGVLLIVIASLFWVYRTMGRGGPVTAPDLRTALELLVRSTTATAARLRAVLPEPFAGWEAVDRRRQDIADQCRREFQSAYYRALALRPLPADRPASASSLEAREALIEGLEAYEWAGRMAAGEAIRNAAVRSAVHQLLDAGAAACVRAAERLTVSLSGPRDPGTR